MEAAGRIESTTVSKLHTFHEKQDSMSSLSETSSSIESTGDLGVKDHDSRRHKLVNVQVYLALICWFCITQGFAINGVNSVNIPMLERRFGLTSTQAGLEACFYDLVGGFIVLFVGYYGANKHQPRILGMASLSLALGSFVMALPHFTTPPYQPPNLKPDICDMFDNTTVTLCHAHKPGLSNYLYVFLLGQSLHGMAGTCLFTLGVAFLDGSVSADMSPLYLGLFYASSAVGPAVGYVLGGLFLESYVDIPEPPPQGLTPNSPGWVGAWWVGFLISCSSCLLIACPILLFPRELPGTVERRRRNKNQAHDNGSQHHVNKDGFGMTLSDMPISLLILLKNPVFVCQSLVAACDGFLIAGLAPFLPKYIANQFGERASTSAMLTGFIAVPAAIIGQFSGGFLVRKLNLQLKGMLRMNMMCSAVVMLLTGSLWIRCNLNNVAGITHPYNKDSTGEINGLASPCNYGCSCTSAIYDPVCIDEVQYFSPCHASCHKSGQLTADGHTIYENCTCAPEQNITTANIPDNSASVLTRSTAVAGKCKTHCTSLYTFAAAFFGIALITCLKIVPSMTVTLRSVADKQRTFAVSVQQVCLRFLGTIPGPIVIGTIMDRACILWQETCEEKGSCWIYDNLQMSEHVFIIALSAKTISFILYIVAHQLYKPPSEEDIIDCQPLTAERYGSTEQ